MAYGRRGPVKAPYRRLPRKYIRAYRAQRSIRRLYPASKFGYMAVPRTEETRARFGSSYRQATPQQRAERAANRYYGRGSYWKKLWRNVVKPVGRAAISGALGGARGAALSLLTGHGMYTGDGLYTGAGEYESNDLVQAGPSDHIPEFSSAQDETGALTITNKEYISDIYGNEILSGTNTVPFVSRPFALNPGNEQVFPWLSQVAANYEEYEIKQLIFTYKSQVQDINSSNGQCGTIIMATLYNPNLPPFPDKQSMMTYAHSASAKTTDDMIHGVECDPDKLSGPAGHFVRTGPIVGDLTNYDHGTFVIGVSNTPSVLSNAAVGELWVSYTVVLRKPKIVTGKGLTISRALAVTYSENNNLDSAAKRAAIYGSTSPSATDNVLCTATKNSLPVQFVATTSATSFTRAKVGAPSVTGDPNAPTYGTIGAVPTTYLGVVIPASYSGALRIQLSCEISATLAAATANVHAMYPPVLFGNVKPLNDLYAAGNDTTDSPSWYYMSQSRALATGAVRTTLTFHVKVSPASNNVDNGFFWTGSDLALMGNMFVTALPAGTYALIQASIDISEYNYGLSTSDTVDSIPFQTPSGLPVTI